MKAILFIAALALFISPITANAALILNPTFEGFTGYWTFSNIGLLDQHDQAKEGAFWLTGNIDGRLTFKTVWVSPGSFSSFQLNCDTLMTSRSNMGWTAATTALLFSNQTKTASGPDKDFVQAEKKPDPISTSILFFAPGLAGILVRRNWPQKLSLRTLKRSIFELIHQAPGFTAHGNLLRRILLMTRFVTYFQFIRFKLRTIQLNR